MPISGKPVITAPGTNVADLPLLRTMALSHGTDEVVEAAKSAIRAGRIAARAA
jgi:hypothetical protein